VRLGLDFSPMDWIGFDNLDTNPPIFDQCPPLSFTILKTKEIQQRIDKRIVYKNNKLKDSPRWLIKVYTSYIPMHPSSKYIIDSTQDEPQSPYLFTLCAEFLSGLIQYGYIWGATAICYVVDCINSKSALAAICSPILCYNLFLLFQFCLMVRWCAIYLRTMFKDCFSQCSNSGSLYHEAI
jgi:hypothetical protein